MGLLSKISGTISSLFQLGIGGPQLKNNSGNIDHVNSTNTGFVNVRGSDPIGLNDFVTLNFGNLNYLTGGGNKGTATLDFGSSGYSNDASVIVTGQTLLLAGSSIQAWLSPATTSNHSPDEHVMEAQFMGLTIENVIAGTGFTIRGTDSTPCGTYGQWNIAWRWS